MSRRWLILMALIAAAAAGATAWALGAAPAVIAAVAIAAAAPTALAAALASARQSAILGELAQVVRRVGAGEFALRAYVGGDSSLSQLARAVNSSAEELGERFRNLETDRRQLRAVLGGMVEGVVLLDAQQQVLFVNHRAAHLLDLPASCVGKRLWEVVRHRRLQQLVAQSLKADVPMREELLWHGPTPRDLGVYAARLAGADAPGAVLVLHDVTDLHRLERVRSEFVANVSHELKTPLTVIKINAETLLGGAIDDPDARMQFVEQIQEQADRLHALILDLLNLARIETGAESFELETVPLQPVIEDQIDRLRSRAETRKQVLEAVPPPDNVAAWADREAIESILANLLDNAIKYTPDGGRIAVRWFANNGDACLQVEDTGIGIPERDLPHVFERFYRVDKARSRELGGTGLGLSIVKHLAQSMSGSVGVESRLDEGSRFTVTLPRAEAATGEATGDSGPWN